MLHHDTLYGSWELPPIIAKLMQTKTARRMRCITMSVFPNELLVHGPMPSRCQHGLGVAYLMHCALKGNPEISDHDRSVLMVAAFLHDAGNPPFTHLAEPFLQLMHNHDGETHLRVVLAEDAEALAILTESGITIDELIDTVTGATELSKILHGSMDADNLDNVWRYAQAARLPVPLFRPLEIAHAFRLTNTVWHLQESVWQLARLWQDARALVYAKIYAVDGFAPHVMLHRALALAFSHGAIGDRFFLLNDAEAVDSLLANPVSEVRTLVHDAIHYRWFEPVFSVETKEPSDALKTLADIKESRTLIASEIRHVVPTVALHDIGVHVGKGRDHRAISMPLLRDGQTLPAPQQVFRPIFRCRVFVAPGIGYQERRDIQDYVSHMTEHPNQLT